MKEPTEPVVDGQQCANTSDTRDGASPTAASTDACSSGVQTCDGANASASSGGACAGASGASLAKAALVAASPFDEVTLTLRVHPPRGDPFDIVVCQLNSMSTCAQNFTSPFFSFLPFPLTTPRPKADICRVAVILHHYSFTTFTPKQVLIPGQVTP